jgi:hypothetical protein
MLFGDITNDKMNLNDFGRIVNYHWEKLPKHFNNINLDKFVVGLSRYRGEVSLILTI